jgi:hypothetical protein
MYSTGASFCEDGNVDMPRMVVKDLSLWTKTLSKKHQVFVDDTTVTVGS